MMKQMNTGILAIVAVCMMLAAGSAHAGIVPASAVTSILDAPSGVSSNNEYDTTTNTRVENLFDETVSLSDVGTSLTSAAYVYRSSRSPGSGSVYLDFGSDVTFNGFLFQQRNTNTWEQVSELKFYFSDSPLSGDLSTQTAAETVAVVDGGDYLFRSYSMEAEHTKQYVGILFDNAVNSGSTEFRFATVTVPEPGSLVLLGLGLLGLIGLSRRRR